MATRYFDVTLSGDVNYVGERWWKGDDINKLWNLFNYNSDNRSVWGLDANGWLQYRSLFGTYAGRYNPDDVTLGDTYFETDIQPAGSGNYEVGFFMRFVDRYTFYYLTYNGGYKNWGTKNIRLYKVSGTTHQVVADVEAPVFNTATTYKFRCELTGNNVKIWKDGTLIINWTDASANPYLVGAFGPWVLGQEFAKWRGFQAKNNSPFSVSKVFKNQSVTNTEYDPASAKMISPSTVSTLLDPEVQAYLKDVASYDSWAWRSFRISSSDGRAIVIFDKIAGKNMTQEPTARMYAYQTMPTSPPLAPTNLQGVALGTNSIRLSWSHADDSEDGFRIYDENDLLVATVGENVLTLTETNLQEGVRYYRKVRAYNAAGESAATNLINVTTLINPPQPPTNFQGAAISDTKILWSWTPGSQNEQSFELVTWDANNQLIVAVTNIPKGTTSYLEDGLKPSTRYVRAVRAKNSAGTSAESNPFEVTTQVELPKPPKYPPLNFYGLGVSDTTIFWYWLDTNDDEDGFELLDKDDNVIAVIGPNQQMFIETGLYSANIYQRKLRAYNSGGPGPETLLATAKTLSDGQDQTGKPVPPTNLRAEVLSTTSAKLTWEYEEDEHFPAVGFKLYMADGSFMMAMTPDMREIILATLLPNTSYRVYVVAFNEKGESFKTNIAEFVTPHIIPPDPTPIDPNDLEDPFYGIEYDVETLEMEKLSAFQSGIGDKLDLVVRNLQPRVPNLEVFSYEVYITGEYDYVFEGVVTRKTWESARIVGTQKEVQIGETITFTEQIASPLFEINWQEINAKFPISNYKLNYTSSNPNVEVVLEREITEFFPQDKIFIELPFKARIINETQTAWYPSIHAGYYYLNQQEWFLYVDDKVQPKDGGFDEEYILKFPYIIRAHGSRYYDAQDFHFVDTTKADFLQGEFDFNIDLEREAGSIKIKDQPSGVFTSRLLRFGRPVTNWYPIDVDWDTDAIGAGANVKIEVGASDYLGNVQTWYPQENHKDINLPEPADKIRYRLTLTEGFRKDLQTPQIHLESWQLDQGYKNKTLVAGETVMITDPTNNLGGTYITPPVEVGTQIETLGTVTLRVNIPGNATVTLYSISFDDPATDYKSPSMQAPWIPLEEASRSGNDVTYRIKSAHGRYLCIAMNLQRGVQAGPVITIPKDAPAKDGITQNLLVNANNGELTMLDPYQPAFWRSNPFFIANPEKVKMPNFTVNPAGNIKLLVTSADTYQDVVQLATQPDGANTWRTVSPGQEVSNLRPWIVVKLVLVPVPFNCAGTNYAKDSQNDFNTNNGMTNWTTGGAGIDGYMEQIYPEDASSYSSETYNIGYLSALSQIKVATNSPSLVKVYLYLMKNGVWQSEVVFGLNADGTVNLGSVNAQGASAFRYRIEVAARPPAGSGGSSGGGAVLNPGYHLEIDPYATDAQHPKTQGNVFASARSVICKYTGQDPVTLSLTYPDGPQTWESKAFAVDTSNISGQSKLAAYDKFTIRFSQGTNRDHMSNRTIKESKMTIMMKAQTVNGVWSGWRAFPAIYDPNSTFTDLVIRASDMGFGAGQQMIGYQFQVILEKGSQSLYNPNNSTYRTVEMMPSLSSIFIDSSSFDNPYYTGPGGGGTGGGGGTTLTKVKIDKIEVVATVCQLKSPIVNEKDGGLIQFITSGYVTPTVSTFLINPILYTLTRVIPTVYEVRIGGHIKEGYALETYAVPMIGELVTDFKEYPLTDKIVEDIVYEYLTGRGTILDSNFQFTDYQLEVDPIYPVILRTEPNGLDKVYGKATRQAGELLYRNVKLYFGETDAKINLRPIPQNGSPICIKNAAGQLLRHVHFRDEYGMPTLTNHETPVVEHQRYIFLQHLGIDPTTLKLWLEVDGVYKEITDAQVIGDRIVLSKAYPSGTPAKVSYRVANSFIVDYNAAPDTDSCMIQVHTPYDPGNLESRRLDIKYEIQKDTPYYLAKEIDLNPLRTVINSGFMYLTDTVYPPFALDVQVNPNVLYRDKPDRVIINAIVLDEFGNPVVGEKADITANVGTIQVLRRVSDENGMVTAAYTPPENTTAQKAIINIAIISRDISKQIGKTAEIFFVDSQATNKIAIIPEKHMVNLGDVVKLKVKVMGANDEPLAGRNVSLYADQGTLSTTIGTTNAFGELDLTYTYTTQAHRNVVITGLTAVADGVRSTDFSTNFEFVNRYLESDVSDSFVFIEAETYDDTFKTIREQILLGVNGV